jgi:hypothetical protein
VAGQVDPQVGILTADPDGELEPGVRDAGDVAQWIKQAWFSSLLICQHLLNLLCDPVTDRPALGDTIALYILACA